LTVFRITCVTVQAPKAAGGSGNFNDTVQHTSKRVCQPRSVKRAAERPVICTQLNNIIVLRAGKKGGCLEFYFLTGVINLENSGIIILKYR
jgi:hypothetical protein